MFDDSAADRACGVMGDAAAAQALGELRRGAEALADEELRQRVRELEVRQRRDAAEMAVLVAEGERRMVHQIDGHRDVAAWVRAETGCSQGRSTRRRRLGRLITTVPVAGQALLAGRIGVDQAEELARARANPRCGDRLIESADLLVEWCEQLCFDEARICIRRWETLADEDGAHRDRAASEEGRRAFVGVTDDGVVVSAAGGSPVIAEELTAIFDRFVQDEFERDAEERARAYGANAPTSLLPRTDAQRRFDAMVAAFRAAASAGPGAGRAAPVTVNVVSDEISFRRALADHGLALPIDEHTARRSDLATRRRETGSGLPITGDDLVRLALHEHVRRVVLDSAGTVIDWGRRRRLFTGAAREAALFRSRRCERAGCTVSIRHCQVDHRRGWTDHGPTDQDNADDYCGHDNRAKHELGIVVKRSTDGYLNWHRRDGTYLGPVGRRPHPDEAEIREHVRRRLAAAGRPPDDVSRPPSG